MSIVVVVIGLGIAGIVFKWITQQSERSASDLGFVSQQWLAEHRSSQTSSRGS